MDTKWYLEKIYPPICNNGCGACAEFMLMNNIGPGIHGRYCRMCGDKEVHERTKEQESKQLESGKCDEI